MDGKKDILVLSGTYACGTGAGILLCSLAGSRYGALYGCAVTAFAVLFLYLALFITGKSRKYWSVAILAGLCGLFCAMTHGIGQIFTVSGTASTTFAGTHIGAVIDRIPYPSPGTAGLVKAITTGDRSALDAGTVAAFRSSGASHILALSGLHLGIIFMILSAVTRPLGRSVPARIVRYVFIVSAAGLYTLAAGASPSLTRAFLFIFLSLTAELLERHPSPVHILCGALTLQLVFNPSVISSTGFQLSYLAMAGIIFLHPALRRLYPEGWKHDPVRKIWDGASLSISCQIFTGPLAWLRFGTFPRYFLLTNLIAMPLTTLLMTVSVATIALSAMGCCPDILVVANDKICSALTWTLQIISGM